MRGLGLLLALWGAGAAGAESLVAARTLPAGTVLASEDMVLVDAVIEGAAASAEAALGQSLRRAVYAGRPILAADLTRPALVDRNQIVTLAYRAGGLTIRTDGRALARGAEGEVIMVLNLASKTRVSGLVAADGTILVGPTKESP